MCPRDLWKAKIPIVGKEYFEMDSTIFRHTGQAFSHISH